MIRLHVWLRGNLLMKHGITFAAIFFLLLSGRALCDDSRTENQLLAEGRKAASTVLTGVQQELHKAIATGGPVHAVKFCNTNLPSIVKKLKVGDLEDLAIKRVSRKTRNPNNQPDKIDRDALSSFEKLPAEDYPQAELIRKTDDGSFRYYKPIIIKSECLLCHGSNIDPEVKKVLSEKYPEDSATGYKPGELRGAIRIEFPGLRE